MTAPVKINEAILDELEGQAKTRYKAVEVQCATLIAIINEVRRSRLVDLRFEVSPDVTAKSWRVTYFPPQWKNSQDCA